MKLSIKNSMKNYMKENIKSFKRKTIEEEQQEINQNKRYNELKDVMTLEEIKQLEEWTDLPIDSIVYDSNTEGIEKCGYEGSKFQNNILNKENLIFYIESEEGDRFGYFMRNKLDNIGKYIADKNGFLFNMKKNILKIDYKTSLGCFLVNYPQTEELLQIMFCLG